MQLVTFLSAASAIVATASADRNAVDLNQACQNDVAYARVVNRCDYPVYLWSVYKGEGCPDGEMVTLKTGEVYNENLADPVGGVGISIKVSKSQACKSDIVQLEYFREFDNPGYNYNYLDVSYIDCSGGDCPSKQEGYYLVSGNQTKGYASASDNTWCPILSCSDADSCATMSYINPNDVQTKTCDNQQNMDFYMCGGHAPTEDYNSAPASSSNQAVYSAPASSSSKAAHSAPLSSPSPTSIKDTYAEKANVAAAAITSAPAGLAPPDKHTTTEVIVVTAYDYEYVNAKRHAHGHARRHQVFHA